MGMNQSLVGKAYPMPDAFEVTAENARAYAEATNAGDISAYGGDAAIAPPMYGVTYSFAALGAPLLDPELDVDMMRLVHGEQDMRFLAPVKPGDAIKSTSTIESITEKSSGELIVIKIASENQRGEAVLEATSGLFVRAARTKPKGVNEKETPKDPFVDLPQVFAADQKVDADQSVRYAEASLDRNPIHTDSDVAKLAGLPGVILHGLCTMAFAHNAIARHIGDPLKIQRLANRFSRPVLMGDTLTTDVREGEEGWVYRTTNQQGIIVLDHGRVDVK